MWWFDVVSKLVNTVCNANERSSFHLNSRQSPPKANYMYVISMYLNPA